MAAARDYQVRIKDTTGSVIAVIVDELRIGFTRRVNAPGNHAIIFPGQSTFIDSIGLDYQVEVHRRLNPSVPFYLEYEGFHRSDMRQTSNKGLRLFTSFGAGYEHLLKRRAILYPNGSAQASKSGVGETVMKAYVDENAGPAATFPPRLLASGVTTGLSMQADGAAGLTWTGDRSFQNLLQVVQDIADAADVDFRVLGTGDALFEFRAQATPIGIDRTVSGAAAGVAPVIFSLDRSNMELPLYALNRSEEVTAAIIMGQGIDSDRVVIQRTDATRIADSPWNRIEIARGAGNESATGGLNAVGDRLLEALRPRESFNFEPIQIESLQYGRDYFLGDLVTARYESIERDVQIETVNIQVQNGKELIRLGLRLVT